MKMIKLVGAMLAVLALVACGGGGGSSGSSSSTGSSTTVTTTTTTTSTGSTTTTSNTAAPASVEVLSSSSLLGSAATTGGEVLITALVKNSGNVGMSGQAISFSATSGVLQNPATSTDASGVATVKLLPGSDKTNRNITVTATSGGVASSLVVAVNGSRVSMSGPSTVASGQTAAFTIQLLDSAGSPIANRPVTLASTLGNGFVASSANTDSSGLVSAIYTASVNGSDIVKAQAVGASAALAVTISGVNFSYTSPASGSQIPLGLSQILTVRYIGSAPLARSVTFSTTRGSIVAADTSTNSSGIANVTVSSTTAGPANVVAIFDLGTAQATLPVSFVAQTPSSLVLQVSPSALAPNASGSQAQRAQIVATVRDAASNPVEGKDVDFTILTDLSSGTLDQASAKTNANGIATVQYIAGNGTTPSGGVVVRGTARSTAVSGTTSLTVDQQALFISMSTDNTIKNRNPQTYQKDFNVYVTDSGGRAAANAVITLDVRPTLYGKGRYALDPVAGWKITESYFSAAPSLSTQGTQTYNTSTLVLNPGYAVFCNNEDLNENGILDAGEDTNSSGTLTPGNPIIISPSTVTTDSSGLATFSLLYGEEYAGWLVARIRAKAIVGGTESASIRSYTLIGLASDFTDSNTPPASQVSPFGSAYQCTNSN